MKCLSGLSAELIEKVPGSVATWCVSSHGGIVLCPNRARTSGNLVSTHISEM